MPDRVKLTKEHRALLEPFEKQFGKMSDDIFEMLDDKLAALNIAVGSVTTTNCSCLIFDAAAWLREQIYFEHLRRESNSRSLLASETGE